MTPSLIGLLSGALPLQSYNPFKELTMRKVLIPAFAGIILGVIARRLELNQIIEFIVAFAAFACASLAIAELVRYAKRLFND